jgi:hypothetical protein
MGQKLCRCHGAFVCTLDACFVRKPKAGNALVWTSVLLQHPFLARCRSRRFEAILLCDVDIHAHEISVAQWR